jgi:multidrug transporter EmrE-like cation transporter
VYVLRAVPLSTAYAMFALAFVMVPSLAHVALYEPLSINAIVGGAIIVLGTVGAVH